MNIKKFMSNLLLATSIFSFSICAMEEEEGSKQERSVFFGLPNEVIEIVIGYLANENNIAIAYNNVVNFLRSNKSFALWLKNEDFRRWLINKLYERFIIKDDKQFKAEKERSLLNAIKLVVNIEDQAHKQIALNRLMQFINIIDQKQKVSDITDKNKEFLSAWLENRLLKTNTKKDVGQMILLNKLINYLNSEKLSNIDIKTVSFGDGDTLLHRAVLEEDNKDMIYYLIDAAGLDREQKNAEGYTPLHLATQAGNESGVRALLAHHANVNSTDEDGNTPLHLAAEQGYEGVVNILLEHGADRTIKNDDSETAAEVAVDSYIRKMIAGYAKSGKSEKVEEPEKQLSREEGKEEEED